MRLNLQTQDRSVWHSTWLCAVLMLPWLQPWAPAPQPNTVPLLISWACLCTVLLLAQGIRAQDLARAWACAALLSSAMGLLQYFGMASVLSPWLHVPSSWGEANANLRQRNQLATLLAIGTLSVLWWQAKGLASKQAAWMLALLAIGNAATASRTGLLHMLLVVLITLWWSRQGEHGQKFSGPWALWALGVYALASVCLPWLLHHSTGQLIEPAWSRLANDEACGSRRVLWGNVLHLIAQKPWTGWGWGELKYAHYMAQYPGGAESRFCDMLGNAHNLPLHLAVTLGVPVTALIFLTLLVAVIAVRPWKSRQLHQQLAWGVLAVIGLHSLLEFPLWYGPFQIAALMSLWMLTRSQTTGTWVWPAAMRAAAAVGFVVLSVTAVDYARVTQIYMPAAQRWEWWRNDPMGAANSSWLFVSSARFAELTLTPVTPQNAAHLLALSQQLLHYSPEPKVIHALIASARLLGQEDLARWHEKQVRLAYPAQIP